MSLDTGAIYTGIAALSITGVTVKDLDEIPDTIYDRDCPILVPDFESAEGGNTLGQGTFSTDALWEVVSILPYTYFHAAVGTGRGIRDHYVSMLDNKDEIFTKISGLNVANVDVIGFYVPRFVEIADATGNRFYGFQLTVTVRERIDC